MKSIKTVLRPTDEGLRMTNPFVYQYLVFEGRNSLLVVLPKKGSTYTIHLHQINKNEQL